MRVSVPSRPQKKVRKETIVERRGGGKSPGRWWCWAGLCLNEERELSVRGAQRLVDHDT